LPASDDAEKLKKMQSATKKGFKQAAGGLKWPWR
jgi:hypothetical protein